ncbi:MAG: aminotransferase class V-fold PLP-dependent enzyme [Clostridia bacterium]
MSKTPLIDALKLIKSDRYHMPGHKGVRPEGFPDAFQIDFTEIAKTGNLFLEDGPIFESETLYREYFGAKQCIYLTGGSTQGILTSVFTLKPKKMLCDRNSHKALCNALGLCDVEPVFVMPEINQEYDVPDVILPEKIEEKLIKNPEINAVFITSPNYFGIYSDVEKIAKVCHKYNAKLIVDEAHGCHFPAVGIKNAIMCGADIAITSAHKTTDCLGQGAVLLSSDENLPLRKNASIFGTSSPSYVIMSSIEMGLKNTYMYKKMPEICKKFKIDIEENTKFRVIKHSNLDPCRLTINTKFTNITGEKLHEILEEKLGIIPEMSDIYNVVFIITPRDEKLQILLEKLIEISKNVEKIENCAAKYQIIEPKRAISVRKAMFCEERQIDFFKAEGEISKQIIAPYPPGVPIIYPGEIILREHIEYFTKMCYNNFEKIYIINK